MLNGKETNKLSETVSTTAEHPVIDEGGDDDGHS